MVRDSRWPFVLFAVFRAVQLLFAIIVLGLFAYVISLYSYPFWFHSFALTTALLTIIYIIINFILYFSNLLLPLAVVVVDAFLLVFWLISLAGLGSGAYMGPCTVARYDYLYGYLGRTKFVDCPINKAGMGFSVLSFILFIPTLIWACLVLHRTRKDLRGRKHRAGLTTANNSNSIPVENLPPPSTAQNNPHPHYYQNADIKYDYNAPPQQQQQQQGTYIDQPYQQNIQGYPTPENHNHNHNNLGGGGGGYNNNLDVQGDFVSPVSTPGPTSYAAPAYPPSAVSPPPPPPPVAAQEMPGA